MIDLPGYPSPAGAQLGLLDFGAFLTPGLGGPIQRVDRMGGRFRISVSMPPMPSAKLGRQWVSKLLQGKSQGARMPFPLLSFNPGLPGSVLVNGASQAGSSLIVDGATPNYVFRDGQPFSIVNSGKHHLHFVTAEIIANGSGQATLSITPMLRKSPADNAVCHFAQPMIEGFIMGEELPWSLSIEHLIGLEFQIVESE